jgi:hypothetical protein
VVLLQQQASATIGTTVAVAGHIKCSGHDIISCTHDKKAHPVKHLSIFLCLFPKKKGKQSIERV